MNIFRDLGEKFFMKMGVPEILIFDILYYI